MCWALKTIVDFVFMVKNLNRPLDFQSSIYFCHLYCLKQQKQNERTYAISKNKRRKSHFFRMIFHYLKKDFYFDPIDATFIMF